MYSRQQHKHTDDDPIPALSAPVLDVRNWRALFLVRCFLDMVAMAIWLMTRSHKLPSAAAVLTGDGILAPNPNRGRLGEVAVCGRWGEIWRTDIEVIVAKLKLEKSDKRIVLGCSAITYVIYTVVDPATVALPDIWVWDVALFTWRHRTSLV